MTRGRDMLPSQPSGPGTVPGGPGVFLGPRRRGDVAAPSGFSFVYAHVPAPSPTRRRVAVSEDGGTTV